MEVGKEISSEADLKFEIADGKVKIIVSYEGKGAGADLAVYAKAEYFGEKLAEAIPGDLDDVIIKGLIAAMK